MTDTAEKQSWDPVVPVGFSDSYLVLSPVNEPDTLSAVSSIKRDDAASLKGLKHVNGSNHRDDDIRSPRSSRSPSESALNEPSSPQEDFFRRIQSLFQESLRRELDEMSGTMRKDIVRDLQALDAAKQAGSLPGSFCPENSKGVLKMSSAHDREAVVEKKVKRTSLRRKLEKSASRDLADIINPIKRFIKGAPIAKRQSQNGDNQNAKRTSDRSFNGEFRDVAKPLPKPVLNKSNTVQSLKRSNTVGTEAAGSFLEKQRSRKFSMVDSLLDGMMVGQHNKPATSSAELASCNRKSGALEDPDDWECNTIASASESSRQVSPKVGDEPSSMLPGGCDEAKLETEAFTTVPHKKSVTELVSTIVNGLTSNGQSDSTEKRRRTTVDTTFTATRTENTTYTKEVERTMVSSYHHASDEDHFYYEYEPARPCGREWWRRFTEHYAFDYTISCFIVFNAITVGLQTDYAVQHLDERVPQHFRTLGMIFCFIFTAEVGLRLFAFGVEFFTNYESTWNIFDFVVVSLQLIEETLAMNLQGESGSADIAEIPDNVNFIRILRLLRLVRIIRLVRLLKFLVELRTMVCSIVASFRTLFWTVMLLLFMIYVASVYLTQVVADFGHHEPEKYEKEAAFHKYYGSLLRSVLTLFQAMTGGVDWDDLVRPMTDNISPWMAVVFSMYICFAVLAMMNVITGVFVESALMTAKEDKEAQLLSQIRRLFQKTDQDGSGTISWEEFQARCCERDMERYFKALDIDISEARGLFTLLDTDNSGQVDMEEFVMGCLRLRGPAKAIDLAAMMYFNKRMASRSQKHFMFIESQIDDVLDLIESVTVDEELDAETSAPRSSIHSQHHVVIDPPMEERLGASLVPSIGSSVVAQLPPQLAGGRTSISSRTSNSLGKELGYGRDSTLSLQRRGQRCFTYGGRSNFPSLAEGADFEGSRPLLRNSRRKITEDLKEDIALATWADLKAHADKKAQGAEAAPSRRCSANSVNPASTNPVGGASYGNMLSVAHTKSSGFFPD